jgi:hypothetical protein
MKERHYIRDALSFNLVKLNYTGMKPTESAKGR